MTTTTKKPVSQKDEKTKTVKKETEDSKETLNRQLTEKAIDIKGKKYVLVSDRINYLAEKYDGKYSIITEYKLYADMNMWVVRATLTINNQTFIGHAQEVIGDGYINKTSALENAETSAVGRACAMAGIGVLDSIASVDEITKAENRAKTTSVIWFNPENPQHKKAIEELRKKGVKNEEIVKRIRQKMAISSDNAKAIIDNKDMTQEFKFEA